MTPEAAQQIVRREESQTFERKKSLSLQREAAESLCGMVNADAARGTVVFGVAPDGTLLGAEPGDLDMAQRSLAQTLGKFEPRLQSLIEVVETDGMRFVVVSAQRNREVPYHEFNGRAFIREGTSTRQLSLVEKRSLETMRNRDRHNGPWRCDRCGSWVGMLVHTVFTNQQARKSYDCRCGGQFWPAF